MLFFKKSQLSASPSSLQQNIRFLFRGWGRSFPGKPGYSTILLQIKIAIYPKEKINSFLIFFCNRVDKTENPEHKTCVLGTNTTATTTKSSDRTTWKTFEKSGESALRWWKRGNGERLSYQNANGTHMWVRRRLNRVWVTLIFTLYLLNHVYISLWEEDL